MSEQEEIEALKEEIAYYRKALYKIHTAPLEATDVWMQLIALRALTKYPERERFTNQPSEPYKPNSLL